MARQSLRVEVNPVGDDFGGKPPENVMVRVFMGPEGGLHAMVGQLFPSPEQWEELRGVLVYGAAVSRHSLAFGLKEDADQAEVAS